MISAESSPGPLPQPHPLLNIPTPCGGPLLQAQGKHPRDPQVPRGTLLGDASEQGRGSMKIHHHIHMFTESF